jgi:hypothetical protein
MRASCCNGQLGGRNLESLKIVHVHSLSDLQGPYVKQKIYPFDYLTCCKKSAMIFLASA